MTLLPLLPIPPPRHYRRLLFPLPHQLCVPHLKVVSGNLGSSYQFTLTMNTIAATPKTSPSRKPVDFYFVHFSYSWGFLLSFCLPSHTSLTNKTCHSRADREKSISERENSHPSSSNLLSPLRCKSESIEMCKCTYLIHVRKTSSTLHVHLV